MTSDVSGVDLEKSFPCIALADYGYYVTSAAAGKLSLFDMSTFHVKRNFMQLPPASTILAFHPEDYKLMAVGMDNSTICICKVGVNKVKYTLKGHQQRITGLAFSHKLDILVSCCASAQLCSWRTDTWCKGKTVPINLPAGKASGDIRLMFHSNQVTLLAFHERGLATYDASNMKMIRQWVPGLSASISDAAYSCNGLCVYACFSDGNIVVFSADTLRVRTRIAASAYLDQVLIGNQALHPIQVSVHPKKPSQFAVQLNDGTVKVIEPLESVGKWGLLNSLAGSLVQSTSTC